MWTSWPATNGVTRPRTRNAWPANATARLTVPTFWSSIDIFDCTGAAGGFVV